MDRSTKSAAALFALAGALLATAAVAEMGPGDSGDRGAMLLEQFNLIDADKDGKITAAEMSAHRQARFTAADTNSDGSLDAAELTAFHTAQLAERMSKRTGQMMQWMDANGDGALSLEEMPDGPSPDRMARLDTDGDGAISRAEAEAAGERMAGHMKKHRKGMSDHN